VTSKGELTVSVSYICSLCLCYLIVACGFARRYLHLWIEQLIMSWDWQASLFPVATWFLQIFAGYWSGLITVETIFIRCIKLHSITVCGVETWQVKPMPEWVNWIRSEKPLSTVLVVRLPCNYLVVFISFEFFFSAVQMPVFCGVWRFCLWFSHTLESLSSVHHGTVPSLAQLNVMKRVCHCVQLM